MSSDGKQGCFLYLKIINLKGSVQWAEGGNPTQAAAAGSSPYLLLLGIALPRQFVGNSPQMLTLKIIFYCNPVFQKNKINT